MMIDILDEAALRSIDAEDQVNKERSPQELRLIMDLIDEKMVRGENLDDYTDPLMPRGAALRGINLKGRRYLQELKTTSATAAGEGHSIKLDGCSSALCSRS